MVSQVQADCSQDPASDSQGVVTVPTTRWVANTRVHLHQVARGPRNRDWFVIRFTHDGVEIASPSFDWEQTVSRKTFEDHYTPLYAQDAPVWGY